MKNVNLLPHDHSRRAELHMQIKRVAALTAVIFLLLILIVVATGITASAMRRAVYRNAAILEQGKNLEASDIFKKAAEIRKDSENAERFDVRENIGVNYLAVVAEQMEGLRATEILIDNNERKISVSGVASEPETLRLLVEKLNNQKIFAEIHLTELDGEEKSGVTFTLELYVEEAQT